MNNIKSEVATESQAGNVSDLLLSCKLPLAESIDVLHVFHVVIATNGAVSFYIDGSLVATHNTGVIASGKGLNESMGFLNRATTATANKGCILDQIAFRHELANQRTGFVFV